MRTLDHGEVRVPLAGEDRCEAALCEHGMLHVHSAGMTAHLTRGGFEHLCSVLLAAQQRLAGANGAATAGCTAPP